MERVHLVREYVRCGKPGCRCMRGSKHGPYRYLRYQYWCNRAMARQLISLLPPSPPVLAVNHADIGSPWDWGFGRLCHKRRRRLRWRRNRARSSNTYYVSRAVMRDILPAEPDPRMRRATSYAVRIRRG